MKLSSLHLLDDGEVDAANDVIILSAIKPENTASPAQLIKSKVAAVVAIAMLVLCGVYTRALTMWK